jgi:nicotinamide mononucleotide transporter
MESAKINDQRIDRAWLALLTLVGVSVSTILADSVFDFSVFLSGILCVGLLANGRRTGYLVGLYNSVAYSLIAWRNGLFGEVYLNLGFYVPTGIAGFVMWGRHLESHRTVAMRSLNWAKRGAIVVSVILITIALAAVLARSSEQNTPVLDAATNTISVAATFLMMWRFKEQWLLYILLNIMAVAMWWFRYRAGDAAGDLMIWMWVVFLVNSVFGYWRWNRGAARPAP